MPPGYQMVNGRKVSPELSTESSEVRFLFAFRSHMLYTSPKWDVPVGIRLWEYVSHCPLTFRVDSETQDPSAANADCSPRSSLRMTDLKISQDDKT